MEPPAHAAPLQSHAIFRWGSGRFALGVESLQEVVAGLELTPLPRAGADWLGVGNLRGEILPAASLQQWFGAGAAGQPVFLILNTSFGKLALAADQIEQVASIDAAATEPTAGDAPAFAPRRWQENPDAAPIFCLDANRLAQKLREQFTSSNYSEQSR